MYDVYLNYSSSDLKVHTVEYRGFDNVEDATKCLSERFAYLMLYWAGINENGLEIYGEVSNADDTFFDRYHLRCGL